MTTRVRNIADLAKLAGVSAGTVSRALANKSLVNPETRERIQALAREHEFRPNQMARRMRTQSTRMIGVVIPLGHERRQHLSDPFFMTMIGALADELTEKGYDLVLSRVIPDGDDWLDRIVDSGMLDGVILIGQSNQFAVIERVAGRYRPLVAWGSHLDGQVHCSIGTDNRHGGWIAGQHLIARGARRLAFLGDVEAPEFRLRFEGLCDAAAAAGLAEPTLFATHLAVEFQERDLQTHLGDITGGYDGLFAATDMIAMATLRVLADHGVRVPDDVRLIGYDDLPITGQTVPRLSTIRQDIREGAQLMVRALFARMGGQETAAVQMQPLLIPRDST